MPSPLWIALQAGCTTVYIPGWAAIIIALILAAPRAAERILNNKGS